MSDPENDREFLEEIKALEDALANEQQHEESPKPKCCATEETKPPRDSQRRANVVSSSSSRGFGQVEARRGEEEEEEEEEDEETKRRLTEGLSAYECNVKLIELLRETKRELSSILERCRENRASVEEKILAHARAKSVDYMPVCAAAMPYFKDARGYPAPANKDVRTKRRNEELNLESLPTPVPWTPRDRNTLWRAIRQEAADTFMQSERLVDEEWENRGEEETEVQGVACPSALPKNFKALVGARGVREFDWLKIAAQNFEDRHSADECSVMWRVFLHPDVNRYRWSRDEDARLEILVEKYAGQNWEAIAEELSTRRTGYQCLVRYKSVERSCRFEDDAWSLEEDRRLAVCVEKFRIGDYVPWGMVARYIPGRIKTQVYYRWLYNSAPPFKKGRFTQDEDQRLLEAVQRYGKNFTRISNTVVSNRSSVQLGNRYKTLMMRKRGARNTWSISEDARLLVLYNEYGADWSNIASAMPDKTRTQVRHRHKSITRYWSKGVSLYEIPRTRNHAAAPPRLKHNTEDNDVEEVKTIRERSNANNRVERSTVKNRNRAKARAEMRKIDNELVEYFQRLPVSTTGTTQPGRKRKFYGSEELDEMSRKLRLLLKTFEAELEIPDELDDPRLTEKDKQLLESVIEWQAPSSRSAKLPITVERYCNDNPRPADLMHFACTGHCNDLRKKFIFHEKIDYHSPPDLNHCRVALNTGAFDTSEEIVKVIGEDTNTEFEKIARFVTDCTREIRVVERVYVLGPEISSKVVSKIEVMPRRETLIVNDGTGMSCSESPSDGNSTRTKKRNSKAKDKAWIATACDGIIQCLDEPTHCLEPNYHTLLALHHIISHKPKTSPKLNHLRQMLSPMSQAATRSMEIFQKRLVQLLKFPIGLSNIFRPDIDVATNLQCFEDSDYNGIPNSVCGDTFDVETTTPSKRMRS